MNNNDNNKSCCELTIIVMMIRAARIKKPIVIVMATVIMSQKMNASGKWICKGRKYMGKDVEGLWVEMENYKSIVLVKSGLQQKHQPEGILPLH